MAFVPPPLLTDPFLRPTRNSESPHTRIPCMAAQCSPVRLPVHPSRSSIRSSHTCSFGRALLVSPTTYRTNARPYRTSNGMASRRPWSLEKDLGPFPNINSDSLRRRHPASKAVVHIEMSTPLIKNASDSEETDSAFPRRMLETIPYSPPAWAESLKLKPQDMFCLGQVSTAFCTFSVDANARTCG